MCKSEKFSLRENTLYAENGLYRWPGDSNEAELFLYYLTLDSLESGVYERNISGSDYYNEDFYITENWSFDVFLNSALYFIFEEALESSCKYRSILHPLKWGFLFRIALHPILSKRLLFFIYQLGVFEVCELSDLKKGLLSLFKDGFICQYLFFVKENKERIGIENLLFFFSFNKEKIDDLVNEMYEKESTESIIESVSQSDLKINTLFVEKSSLLNARDFT